ncbi:putative DNA topoisomerase 2-binding protein 1 [Apostichopus japonicus]|uniref:Putative DNA topoisomerase 2-binding protein 1 n=1 Tax=Stichopus japonicus TaxID=307972 RepID=A0A2G8LAV8_STIJA|nr:putative DNA topoisomerase 2-binding protein 1 [Apostichopus japonicus]
MCDESETILPTGGNFLFRPLVLSHRTEPLLDCVITFSQYSGVEKQYLTQFAEILGATCQDYFQRKAKKGAKANTHLVLQSPEGSKYEAAKKWGIPAVTTEWILHCAKEGKKLPEEMFLVDGAVRNDDIPDTNQKEMDAPSPEFPVAKGNFSINPCAMDVAVTPTHAAGTSKRDAFKTPNIGSLNLNSAKRPCSNSLEKSAKKVRRGDFGRIETPMEGTPSTPGMFLRASQDFLPKLGIDTPASARPNRRKSSLPYEVCLYENLVSAVEVTASGKVERNQNETENSEVFSDKENESKTNVLRGLAMYVAEKLPHQRGELHRLVKSLGGDVKWRLDATCSHFIFQGKSNDTDKEFRRARKGNVSIVSPEWLSACKENNRRMDEKLYPHTLNPNMSLSLSQVQTDNDIRPRKMNTSVTAPSVSRSPQIRAEVIEDQDLSMEEEELMIAEAEAIEEKENSNSDEQREEFQRQFAQIMSTGNPGSSKRRGRRQSSNTDGNSKDGNDSVTESRRSSRRLTRSRRGSKNTNMKEQNKDKAVEHDSDPSCVITWDDASSRVCRENALARLRGEGFKEESFEDEDQQKAEVKELTELGNFHASNETEESPSKVKTPPPIRLPPAKPAVAPERTEEEQSQMNQVPIKRVFLFTGLTEQERIDYGALIEQLGGEVADKTYYDKSCTHMIVGNPSKNEKYLAAVASGKWILHRSYMVECQKAGKFIEEAPHELNASMFPEKMSRASVLCSAPKRWREQLQMEDADHHGAFDGWKVLLVVEESKEKGLKRILEAGCGVVLTTRVPFPASSSEATHLFLSSSKMKGVKDMVDFEQIVSNGTLCLKPEYIADFLIKSPSPDPSLFLLSEVRSILERIATETTQIAVATRSGSLQRRKNRESATPSKSSSKRICHR